MRTALTLLFLLALAAMPGALLPQLSLNAAKVDEYVAQHGWWGDLLLKLGFFEVYATPWFAAIYLLLFVSLVGCLLPRTWEYFKQMRARPVLTPRNLSRMPHHAQVVLDVTPEEAVAKAKKAMRGWRMDAGEDTVSAERGYLRETGNLVFHFALLGLLVSFALGKMFSYEGQIIVQADGGQFCNGGVFNYDSFRPGLRVDGTDLTPFCVEIGKFSARYLDNGQPVGYEADIRYQSGDDLASNTWRPYNLQVNHPLRTEGDRVYLLGHGYTPTFTVTFPNGEKRTQGIQWLPSDQLTLASEGATKFDPPGITDSEQRRKNQIAVTGLLAPTPLLHGSILTSKYPALNNPMVAVDVYRGDLGVDDGRGQSIFSIDMGMVDQGRLQKVARKNLALGEEIALDDGTKVRFDSVNDWVSLQVSHDPTQGYVLLFAVFIILGLGVSLTVKRRRVWVRATRQEDGRTLVEVGGLARTDQAGYGEEFTRLARAVLNEEKS
ncbi:cytochrome c biogenesis protein ResB [Lentzea kentuckyensis]|uniref:cytochrome c biogenesis protein ResB n=1 Tax=Lentzea kentuckyensis TaxID=360086 RepID=UPI000A3D162E|nr:cytochrome c biogenesis protein ResB [Lentzea kentuckyensis]